MHDMCAAHCVDRPQEIGNNHIPVMRHRTKFLRYHLSDCRHFQNPLPFQLLSPALRQRAASCARDSSTRVSRFIDYAMLAMLGLARMAQMARRAQRRLMGHICVWIRICWQSPVSVSSEGSALLCASSAGVSARLVWSCMDWQASMRRALLRRRVEVVKVEFARTCIARLRVCEYATLRGSMAHRMRRSSCHATITMTASR